MENIRGVFVTVFLFGFLLCSIGFSILNFFSNNSIESKIKIEPKIKLIITEDNKIDTLYIYHK